MADDAGGEKTEKPTPKKLRDARRKGDVPKSVDVALAVGLLVGMVVLWQLLRIAPPRLAALMEAALAMPLERNFRESLEAVGAEAVMALVLLSALVLVPIALASLLAMFLQIGPLLALEKIVPKLSNLDPVAGLKRLFGADSLVQCIKAVLLTAVLFAIAAYLIATALDELLMVTHATPMALAGAMIGLVLRLCLWTLAAFAFFAVIDLVWQHHTFEKKMKMSLRDIKDEHKNTEGDPRLKGERKKLAKQWAGEGAKKAASKASVLVVNPVHVAVAVLYDERQAPVPRGHRARRGGARPRDARGGRGGRGAGAPSRAARQDAAEGHQGRRPGAARAVRRGRRGDPLGAARARAHRAGAARRARPAGGARAAGAGRGPDPLSGTGVNAPDLRAGRRRRARKGKP